MSWGTFTLFSFLQQPNTGVTPPRGPNQAILDAINNGTISSGLVNDSSWPFPFAGTAVPIQIVEGVGGAFPINLYSDFNSTGDNGNPATSGLRYTTATHVISGQFTNDGPDLGNIWMGTSGAFYPMDSGQSTSFIVLSGSLLQSPPDINNNSVFLSGTLDGLQSDLPYPKILLSGNLINDSPDLPKMGWVFSGDFLASNLEKSSLSVNFRGSFVPVCSDSAQITYNLSGFSSFLNIIVNNFTDFQDTCNLTYGFGGFLSTKD